MATTEDITATPSQPFAGLPPAEHCYPPNPGRRKARALLQAFLRDPINPVIKTALLSSLVDYELIHRFRDL